MLAGMYIARGRGTVVAGAHPRAKTDKFWGLNLEISCKCTPRESEKSNFKIFIVRGKSARE